MWRSISHSIPGFGRKKNVTELARACHDVSDDETSSNASIDEGLECPICWESFNIVENVPYQELLPSLDGREKNGDRVKSPSSICRDRQQIWSPRCSSVIRNYSSNTSNRRMHRLSRPNSSNNRDPNSDSSERLQLSFHKSLDFFIRMTAKFPLVILLLIVIFAIPTSAAVLMLYLVITIVFALPSFLVLYFAYPALDWLGREIRT
ncbi:hypothetical protein DH2020_032376 [Rehmannia glutinosa]|uniref:Uncharacterized protein n=1 Tax=Rehmannia glutinosa TaxID=99300 RepID=A0ABR0VIB3_REHGL